MDEGQAMQRARAYLGRNNLLLDEFVELHPPATKDSMRRPCVCGKLVKPQLGKVMFDMRTRKAFLLGSTCHKYFTEGMRTHLRPTAAARGGNSDDDFSNYDGFASKDTLNDYLLELTNWAVDKILEDERRKNALEKEAEEERRRRMLAVERESIARQNAEREERRQRMLAYEEARIARQIACAQRHRQRWRSIVAQVLRRSRKGDMMQVRREKMQQWEDERIARRKAEEADRAAKLKAELDARRAEALRLSQERHNREIAARKAAAHAASVAKAQFISKFFGSEACR